MYEIIKDYHMFLDTLKRISYDDDKAQSLIEDERKEHKIYNFDGISKKFCKKVRGQKNSSCDGYYEKADGTAYLIEFKNQPEGNIDKEALKNKVYDSIATLVMNENITRKEVAGRTSVIVVYNDEAEQIKTDTSYNSSEGFNLFSKKLGMLSNRKGIHVYDKKFDLAKYQGVLVEEVFTVDKKVFETEFMEVLFGERDMPRK